MGFSFLDEYYSFYISVIMMVRLPFGVANWELILSMSLLSHFISLLATWFAGRIYRTGILMYGKKQAIKNYGNGLSIKFLFLIYFYCF